MERSRGPLGALGGMLAGGGQAIIGQAQSLAGDVQRRIADAVPPVLSGELDRLTARIQALEFLLTDGGREVVGPVRAPALGAIENAAGVRARLDDVLERRVTDLQARAAERSEAGARMEDAQWPWK